MGHNLAIVSVCHHRSFAHETPCLQSPTTATKFTAHGMGFWTTLSRSWKPLHQADCQAICKSHNFFMHPPKLQNCKIISYTRCKPSREIRVIHCKVFFLFFWLGERSTCWRWRDRKLDWGHHTSSGCITGIYERTNSKHYFKWLYN